MYLKALEIAGFKSFAKKTKFEFSSPVTAVVGPNGSGKSNVVEAFRWVLGEQSAKAIRAKKGEDFIFHGSQSASRLNHASVQLTLNNSSRFLAIDFDEVTIARHVYRDGVNEYYLNGSKVRLKDIVELLAGAGLGTSQHHIISQGEADRLLYASSTERREMIADALGLTLIEYKKEESARKLAKTEENLKQVELLRKELAPHLKFLERQVEQIRKIESVKIELVQLARNYFGIEFAHLESEKSARKKDLESKQQREKEFEKKLSSLKIQSDFSASPDVRALDAAIRATQQEISAITHERIELTHKAGRLEGALEEKHTKLQPSRSKEQEVFLSLPKTKLRELTRNAATLKNELVTLADIDFLKKKIAELIELVTNLYHESEHEHADLQIKAEEELRNEIAALSFDLEMLRHSVKEREDRERALHERVRSLMNERREKESDAQASLREYNEQRVSLERLSGEIHAIEAGMSGVIERETALKKALSEISYVTQQNLSDSMHVTPENHTDRDAAGQDATWRKMERMRARIEEFGSENTAALQEYESVKERYQFLENEVSDLTRSREGLEQVMKELTERLETQFEQGREKINKEFSKYFELLFGGGSASLKPSVKQKRPRLAEEALDIAPMVPEKPELGIDIDVSLPRKKIRSLDLLSGGERTLVSIALLFAVTQVNPPPFLVLDETDAALDESNSKKYGDMLEALSRQTQLIIITHNRETMSHAGILYGITLGPDAISRVLSVKLEDTEKVFTK